MDLPPNENRGPAAIAVFWTLTGIAGLFVGGRFYARWIIRGIGVDDWMILFTMLLFVITSSMVTNIARHEGFRHLIYVPIENAVPVARSMLLAQVFNICAFGTSKFAVGYQLLRVLQRTSHWRKAFIWTLITLTLIYNVIEAVLTMFQCTPAKAAWDPMVKGKCWSMNTKLANIYAGGVYNVVTDVILAVMPLPVVWKLNIGKQDRIRLCLLLSLGLLAAICGSIKLSYAHTLRNIQDLTWGTYELDVWSGAELFVIVVCCSIPPLNVFWQRIKRGSLYSRGSAILSGSSQNSSGGGNPKSKRHSAYVQVTGPSNAEKATDEEAKVSMGSSSRSRSTTENSASELERGNLGRSLGRIEAVTEITISSKPSNGSMR